MILPLEQQVTSLELSKKLKELGVKQDSLFYWTQSNAYNKYYIRDIGYRLIPIPSENEYSAFTVAELGEMLPDELCINGRRPYCFIAKGTQEENKWTIGYSTMDKAITPFYTKHNEAEARAKMLIYLIENKLIEVPK